MSRIVPKKYKKRINIQLPEQITGCIWIPLTQNKFALVDEIDKDFSELNWYASTSSTSDIYYANRHQNKDEGNKVISLHEIIGYRIGLNGAIDHIDGDGLNCRRSNLRAATKVENAFNRNKNKNNTSGYKGVTYRASSNRWLAQIMHKGKGIFLGSYITKEEAATAYNTAASKYAKEFAKPNDI